MLAHILHKVGTLIVLSLHADYTKFAQILQFINSLSASKSNLGWAAHKNLRSACSIINYEDLLLGSIE